MTELLNALAERGVLTPLDLHFARAMGRLVADVHPTVLLGAAFASRAVAHGHVCADLRRLLERPLVDGQGELVRDLELPPIFEWVMELGQSALCSDGSRPTPLVFDGEARLYLTRYWRYERLLADALLQRASRQSDDEGLQDLQACIERLFAAGDSRQADPRQALAARIAARRNLTVITGGPGTGKTSTVVRVLALLIEQELAADRGRPRIKMLAPTGKAAARLTESITAGLQHLSCSEEVKAAIPTEASTIHRALGFRPGRPTRFAHDADNPLPADVVLVDEASMVDLALMAKLVQACPASARLLLLGDKDQLASVEAGAILGDICNAGGSGPVPSPQEASGIAGCVVELSHSFRFDHSGGIGRLARAINAGRGDDALAQLGSGDDQVSLLRLREAANLPHLVRRHVLPELQPYLQATDPAARLHALTGYRLLSAHRQGPFGTVRLNALIEELLASEGRIELSALGYAGRPILVTQNDYQLELYNGDVGVIHPDADGTLRAWFRSPDGTLRSLLPARLPPHESVWAMTVHKSQGSEFDRVGLLIPPAVSMLLTRELLYTGVTRAKKHVSMIGEPTVLHEAVARRIDRASGLRDALWPGDDDQRV